MTSDDRQWLHSVADALDRARRYREDGEAAMVTIKVSDELARSVADRVRAIAERDAITPP
jgi:hypothetical protein